VASVADDTKVPPGKMPPVLTSVPVVALVASQLAFWKKISELFVSGYPVVTVNVVAPTVLPVGFLLNVI
jgi:hypothetical protein